MKKERRKKNCHQIEYLTTKRSNFYGFAYTAEWICIRWWIEWKTPQYVVCMCMSADEIGYGKWIRSRAYKPNEKSLTRSLPVNEIYRSIEYS